jgi:hypothetical protein
MNQTNLARWVLGLLSVALMASLGLPQEPAIQPDPQDPIQIQPRGPLHEAFAQPFDVQPGPGPVVPKEPPPMIPEDPPEQRPDNPNAQWYSGYWAWDAQKGEYMWVSGTYRVAPQGRTFMPGYWQRTDDGWRWVQGFWANANQPELPYTPEPPATLDQGPSMPPPDDNSIYIPGAWVYRDGRFIWRPGYYAPAVAGRVWQPPQYYWTPNGYLFNDGYYDCPFEDRGIFFPTVWFARPLWNDVGWRYRPRFYVGFGSFFDCAFVNGGRFFYGNYYDPYWGRHGYRPWYQGRGRYDPVFAYHGWQQQRNNPNWFNGVQQTYAQRTAGTLGAPRIATAPLNEMRQVKLTPTTATNLQTQRAQAQQTQQLAAARQRMDAAALSQGTPNFRGPETRTLRLAPANTTTTASAPAKTGVPFAPQIVTTPKGDSNPGFVRPSPKLNNPLPTQPANPTPAPKVSPTPTQPINPTPSPKVNPTPVPKVNPTQPINPTPAPKVNPTPAPKVNPAPTQPINPTPVPKVNPAPTPAPRIIPQPAPTPAPRIVPQPVPTPAPRINPAPAPAPRVNPAPAPRVNPAPAPRPAPPPPRANPAPAPRPAPKAGKGRADAGPATPAPRTITTVASPPRAQAPAPRAQSQPRVSAPQQRSNPAPAKSSPPAKGNNNSKKR